MTEQRDQLLATFDSQYRFSKDYSPLYAALFKAVAGWLSEDRQDPVGDWFTEASYGRKPLNVSLLLAAGLHRDILLGQPELASLALYYPSAGGALPAGRPQEEGWHTDHEFETTLHQAILARRDQLRAFIQSSQVQTNETGRGISWLLPASLAGWSRFHLLDLGASAGLNLAADRRSYHFVDAGGGQPYLRLGEGQPVQFQVRTTGDFDFTSAYVKTPQVIGRLGCDLNPFLLRTPIDEVTLAAFVWADQTARLERLREGIAAYHQVNSTLSPVKLHAVELPEGLPGFLERHIADDREALICYNTYIRMYLPDRGVALRQYLSRWARDQARPIVWIQWEPPSRLDIRHGKAPEIGWLAWMIDMWHGGEEYHWHVAWVNPHGQLIHWLPGLNGWIDRASSMYA